MRTNYSIKKLIFIASLAAISVVFGIFEIPLGLPWLKLDISELAVLVAAIVLGYKNAILLIFVRGIFRQLFQGQILLPDQLVGEAIAMIASGVILTTYYLTSKLIGTYKKPLLIESVVDPKPISKKELFATTLSITLALTVILITLNILFLTPIYLSAFSFTYAGTDQGAYVQLTRFHFSIFTLLDDPGMANIFFTDLSSLRLYVTFIIVNYVPLNLSKGLITSMLFLPIKSTLEKVEL